MLTNMWRGARLLEIEEGIQLEIEEGIQLEIEEGIQLETEENQWTN